MTDAEYGEALTQTRDEIAAPMTRIRSWLDRHPSSRRRWMVVDDQPHVAEALSSLLTPHAAVTVAHSGEDALALGAERHDAVFVDLDLGSGMTGVDLIEAIRGPVIVIVSGYPDEVKRVGDELGLPWVGKPFDLAKLGQVVEAIKRARSR